MGKNGTSTKHHCPGKHKPIGDIPADNCRPVKVGSNHFACCDQHEMPCPRGDGKQCKWYCLKNQWGCLACIKKRDMTIVHEKEEEEQEKKQAAAAQANAWYTDSGKPRKPKTKGAK